MLTKQQFFSKHRTKFAGLTAAEKNARYRSYVAGFNNPKAVVRTPVRSQRNSSPIQYLSLAPCTVAYAQALVDPFNLSTLPCIPDDIVLPSFKLRTYARGIFATGTNGIAFATLDPWLLGVAGGPCGYVTNSAFPLGTYLDPTTSGTGLTPIYSNSTLDQADFSAEGYSGRLVGAGLRVRYVGSEFTRAGLGLSYRSPNNYNIPSQDLPALLQFQESSTVPVSRGWHYVFHRPSNPGDLSYGSSYFKTSSPEYSMLMFIQGAAPSSPFEFEAVGFYEVTGPKLPALTASEADTVGLGIVRSALPNHAPTTSPEASFSSFLSSLGGVARSTMSTLTSMAGVAAPVVSTSMKAANLLMDSGQMGSMMRAASPAVKLLL